MCGGIIITWPTAVCFRGTCTSIANECQQEVTANIWEFFFFLNWPWKSLKCSACLELNYSNVSPVGKATNFDTNYSIYHNSML